MWSTFGLIVLFVILDAVADATRDSKKKLSHIAQSLFILSGLGLAVVYPGNDWKDALVLLGWYMVNRIFLFNIVYNSVRGLYIDYLGTTSYYDIILYKVLLKLKVPVNFYIFILFCIWFSVNVGILSNYEF